MLLSEKSRVSKTIFHATALIKLNHMFPSSLIEPDISDRVFPFNPRRATEPNYVDLRFLFTLGVGLFESSNC